MKLIGSIKIKDQEIDIFLTEHETIVDFNPPLESIDYTDLELLWKRINEIIESW